MSTIQSTQKPRNKQASIGLAGARKALILDSIAKLTTFEQLLKKSRPSVNRTELGRILDELAAEGLIRLSAQPYGIAVEAIVQAPATAARRRAAR